MNIVMDSSAIIAVIVAEPERDAIIAATAGHALIGPGSIPWEVGNAFSAMISSAEWVSRKHRWVWQVSKASRCNT